MLCVGSRTPRDVTVDFVGEGAGVRLVFHPSDRLCFHALVPTCCDWDLISWPWTMCIPFYLVALCAVGLIMFVSFSGMKDAATCVKMIGPTVLIKSVTERRFLLRRGSP